MNLAHIHAAIRQVGPMPFADFMQLALYHPEWGYYERRLDQIGRQGDFFTSVSVGPLFGQLLASQFAHWFLPMPVNRLNLVEAGAHDGSLACDILNTFSEDYPEIIPRLTYWVIEPSAKRQTIQRVKLAHYNDIVRFVDGWSSLHDSIPLSDRHLGGLPGIIFANELLDALPVYVFRWSARLKIWQELGITCGNDQLAWAIMPPLGSAQKPCSESDILRLKALDMLRLPENLLAVLPDGFTTETSPQSAAWWMAAAHALSLGYLMTLDYGLLSEERFSPGRHSGNLKAFFQHRLCEDVLARPGEQDITAPVDFSLLERVGMEAGLTNLLFEPQEQFLTRQASSILANPNLASTWDTHKARQFTTLFHPNFMGRSFRVLVQARQSNPEL